MPIERWRTCLTVTLLASLSIPASGCATRLAKRSERRQPPETGLLEFLGTADPTSHEKHPGGASWMVYLSKLKLGKVAKTTGGRAPRPVSKSRAHPGSPGAGSRS